MRRATPAEGRAGVCVATALLLAAAAFAEPPTAPAAGVASPRDLELRQALALVYDGAFAAAEARLAELAVRDAGDPVAPYLQALALEWRLEQAPETRLYDEAVLRLADLALGRAEAALARDPRDGRALLARGAAHGVKSRLHLFRWERGPASREAVRMREGLLSARAAGVDVLDLDFGLGLYDYYADTLPRFFRLLAWLLRIPGGDRERGRAAIARAARGGSLFHDAEARVQMFDIHTFFEQRPDRALFWMRAMRRDYPGWPLWGLRLADLLREPLGLFAESAAVCREIVDAAEARRHVNYQPIVAEMARVRLAEALLAGHHAGEALACARTALSAQALPEELRGRAELVAGRSLELQGHAEEARSHFQSAARGGHVASARRAREALRRPLDAGLLRAHTLLAQAQHRRELGDERGFLGLCLAAFAAAPEIDEGRLCAARAALDDGKPDLALVHARRLMQDAPAWLRPDARLVAAAALGSLGDAAEALEAYRSVWEQPYGRPALRAQAAEGIRTLGHGARLADHPAFEH